SRVSVGGQFFRFVDVFLKESVPAGWKSLSACHFRGFTANPLHTQRRDGSSKYLKRSMRSPRLRSHGLWQSRWAIRLPSKAVCSPKRLAAHIAGTSDLPSDCAPRRRHISTRRPLVKPSDQLNALQRRGTRGGLFAHRSLISTLAVLRFITNSNRVRWGAG